MNFDTDIAIVGGGLNGPILALALAQAGINTTVIDALTTKVRKNPSFDGRSAMAALAKVPLLSSCTSITQKSKTDQWDIWFKTVIYGAHY